VQVNVNSAVGNRHGWTNYLGSNEIVRRLRQETLVETARRNSDRPAGGVSLRVSPESQQAAKPGG